MKGHCGKTRDVVTSIATVHPGVRSRIVLRASAYAAMPGHRHSAKKPRAPTERPCAWALIMSHSGATYSWHLQHVRFSRHVCRSLASCQQEPEVYAVCRVWERNRPAYLPLRSASRHTNQAASKEMSARVVQPAQCFLPKAPSSVTRPYPVESVRQVRLLHPVLQGVCNTYGSVQPARSFPLESLPGHGSPLLRQAIPIHPPTREKHRSQHQDQRTDTLCNDIDLPLTPITLSLPPPSAMICLQSGAMLRHIVHIPGSSAHSRQQRQTYFQLMYLSVREQTAHFSPA